MFVRTTAVVVALVLAVAAPTAAQDLAGRQAALCADRLLGFLTEQPQRPYNPTFHVGLATWFMGCTYYLPPAVGPILDTMRADIETIDRHREDLPDASELHRGVVCGSWLAIYSSTYQWLLYEYGSDIVGDLPAPDARAADCQRWAEGRR